MPANVESMFHFGPTPWHGFSTEINEQQAFDIKSCIKAAGLDWTVENRQCYIQTDEIFPAQFQTVPAYATIRTSDNSILGIVGKRYSILQNLEAFKVFQPFLDNRLCRLNTAGSLDEGKRIWILAEIISTEPSAIRPDDYIRKFILLSHGHDGKNMVRFGLTPIRVVCANTLAMAHGDKLSQLFKIKHTQNMVNSINDVRDIIKTVIDDYNTTLITYKTLASVPITKEQLDIYIKKVFSINEDRISTRSFNIIERVKSYFIHAPGARGESYWDAYQAFTYYLNHDYGNNANNRLNSLWFGRNVVMNKYALDIALQS